MDSDAKEFWHERAANRKTVLAYFEKGSRTIQCWQPSSQSKIYQLMADGVAPDKLHPLDVDRAFSKLEEIKPHVTVWWTTGAQSGGLAWLAIDLPRRLYLEHYRRIYSEAIYWRSFAVTFEISLLVTLLALVLGYPIAYAASSASRGWSILILALVVLPFWTSVLVRAYAWLRCCNETA